MGNTNAPYENRLNREVRTKGEPCGDDKIDKVK